MTKLLIPLATLALGGCVALTGDRGQAVMEGGGYAVEVCDAAYAGRAAACSIRGEGPRQTIRATLISNGTLFVGGRMLIDGAGRVEAAGCHVPEPTDAVVLDCPGALVSAGLINLHEHIDYSYQQPARPPVLKWQHRNEWRRLPAEVRGFEGDAPKDKQVQAEVAERAMLRHALSGTTAISGAKDFNAFLRNLRLADAPLPTPFGAPVLDSTFPLNDAASMAVLAQPCDAAQLAAVKFNPSQAFIPHVGEGTGDGARHEVDCVLDAIQGKQTPSAFIHGVAITQAQVARLRAQNVAVVLSPRSNLQLYGTAAPVAALKAGGVTLGLGTDWSPSGSLTLLDEARCLARYNRDSLGGLLGAADLHRMMTSEGARAVGLQGAIGALAPGEWADLVIFDTEGRTALDQILERTALRQTLAVMIGGRIASAPQAWAGQWPQLDRCDNEPRDLCGSPRMVCGASAQRPIAQLLRQSLYRIDDRMICDPLPTDDCVERAP